MAITPLFKRMLTASVKASGLFIEMINGFNTLLIIFNKFGPLVDAEDEPNPRKSES
jgi:hypothetical protein